MLKLFSVKSFSVNCGYVDKLLTNCGKLSSSLASLQLPVVCMLLPTSDYQLPGMCM